jgi:hypothetical protein
MDAPVVLKAENKNIQRQLLPPTPLAGGGEAIAEVVRIEPERPTPDAEVHAALQAARELRTQRKAERRQRRYAGARERRVRRCEEPTPVKRAVTTIMAVLRVCPSLWGTRRAIQTSVERLMEVEKVPAERTPGMLMGAWKDYCEWTRSSEYACGLMTWFGQCRWQDGGLPKDVLRAMKRAQDASVGRYEPPNQPRIIDLKAVREKMKLLGVEV